MPHVQKVVRYKVGNHVYRKKSTAHAHVHAHSHKEHHHRKRR